MFVCLVLAALPAGGYVKKVGSVGDFVTITNAVASAADKDVILVSTGYYFEAVSIVNKSITIEGGYNSNCTAKVPGTRSTILAPVADVSVIYVATSGVELIDLSIVDGRPAADPANALYGAGLHLGGGCVVFLKGCEVESNVGRGNGGGIFSRTSVLRLTNTVVRNNIVSNGVPELGRGGGIYCLGGELILQDGAQVKNNRAETTGGGICAVMGANCRVHALTAEVSGNRAEEGAGIAAASAATVVIDAGATVHGNVAEYFGGGLLLTGGATGIVSGANTFVGYNLPANYSGNAVTNVDGRGGGAAVLDSRLEVTHGASIRHNTASYTGGGIHLSNAVCLVDGATIGWIGQTNRAVYGGGIFCENDCRVILTNGARVLNGVAEENGGGICGYPQCDVRIYASTVSACTALFGDGAGLYVSGCTLTGVSMRVVDSVATSGNGGGICGSYAYGWFTNLTVTRNGGADGGGVSWRGGTLRLMDSMIASNAALCGGAMFLVGGNTALSRLHVSENFSIMDGGGLYLSNAVVTVSNSVFQNNFADRGEDELGDGGGIWAGAGSRLTFHDVLDQGSTLCGNGGDSGAGLYAADSTVRVQMAEGALYMGGNIALRSGGGVYLLRSSLLATGFLAFVTNMAVLSGGGLGASQSLVLAVAPTNVEASLFYHNDAWRNGGALYGVASTVRLSRAWLWQNTASNHGGGLCLEGGSVAGFKEVAATENAAGDSGGGAALFAGSTLRATNGVLNSNSAERHGGGLFLASGATAFFVSPVDDLHRIDFNRAMLGGGIAAMTGTYFYADDKLVLSRNDAGESGGGLYLQSATAALRRACVKWNTATNVGGGISAVDSSAIDLQDTLLAGNVIGWSSGGGGLRLSDSSAQVVECTIVSNVGVGIYVAFAVSGSATVTSSIVYGNTPGNMPTGQVVSYSCVEDGYPGTANFDAPPRLYSHNFHLTYDSPCRGQGAFVSPTDVDVDGELRGAGFSDCGFDEFLDGDQDLLPDIVETASGVWDDEEDTGSDPADADTDDDGAPDGEEWIADTDPNDTNDSLRVIGLWCTNEDTRVRWVGGTKAVQQLQVCEDNAMTNWSMEQIFYPPTLMTNLWVCLGTSNRIFFRVTAARP